MTQILETVMLVCFGASWPLSVYKHYRAGTAVGMSKGFIMLVICGYIAGATAKIVSPGGITYVFYVYLFNLSMVTLDLILYFRNRALDNAKKPLSRTEGA